LSLTGNNGLLAAAGANQPAYTIDQSLRFNDGDSACLQKAYASSGNRKTWTWSGWVKRSELGSATPNAIFSSDTGPQVGALEFPADDTFTFYDYTIGGSYQSRLVTTALYRDPAIWYHIVVAYDTTQATSSNRIKIYINGSQVTDFSTETYPSQDLDGYINYGNNSRLHGLGKNTGLGDYLDGYLAEVHFIEGTALDASSFGETDSATNQWKPIKYTGSHGTNGFYMNFSDSSSLGTDSSGSGNNYTPSNLAATDQVLDSPSNNFCVMNPLDTFHAGSSSFAEGNLKVSEVGGNAKYTQVGNFGMSSGKWYFEFCGVNSDNTWMLGVADVTKGLDRGYTGSAGDGLFVYVDGSKYAPTSTSSYGVSWTHGDVMGVAVDMDNNAMYFAKNNTWMNSGVPTSGSTKTGAAYTTELVGKTWVAAMGRGGTNNTITATFNFGQDSSFAGAKTEQGNGGTGEDFFYTPPTGYKALNTDNLDDPAIALPTDNFNTVLYTGDNTDGRSITGVGFEPNFVWQKNRSSSLDHVLYDNVRTVGKELRTNTTGAETFSGYISSFNSDGFTVNTGGSGIANSNGGSHVAWNWKGSDTPSKTFVVTVTNPGSGNRYTLDGKVSGTNAMPITIEEGGTYTFDQSDNSNSGHPLRFSTTANGTHGGGSEYTTGVTVSGTPGSAGAKTVITVAASAATLYFYCTAHSGMGAQASTPGSGGGVSYLDGTIASVVNANTTAGFSIISFTGDGNAGATFGHGLSQAPEMWITKSRSATGFWYVGNANYSSPAGNYYQHLELTAAQASNTGVWNGTLPSSTVITLGNLSSYQNVSGTTYISYAFHSVEGYSKVASYTGNGSADGAFVYTGFKPAFLLIKRIAGVQDWMLADNKTSPYNQTENMLRPAQNAAQQSGNTIDILSNGFKPRLTGNAFNASGESYLVLAIAESPFKYANAR
jgi:hypothetical protein